MDKILLISGLISKLVEAGEATAARIKAIHVMFEATDEELNKILDSDIVKLALVKSKAQAEIDRVGSQTV